MEKDICYIVGAGENWGLDFSPKAGDYVIAADAGLRYLQEAGIPADLVIGDFDTLGHCPEHENVKRLNPIKDDTDTLAALREGIALGYRRFDIYCGMGGRVEHSLANIQLLAFLAQEGRQGFLYDRDAVLTAICGGAVLFPATAKGGISVFSYSERCLGVCERGLKYSLDMAELTNGFPIGVSNEFTGRESSVSLESGTLLLVYPRSVIDINITKKT